MRQLPHRPVAALPGERVIDIDAVPLDGERPPRSLSGALMGRYRLILGFTAVIVAAVAVWTLVANPTYEASAVVQVDPERPRVVSFTDIMPPEEPYNERVVDAYYQTQLELIKSGPLLERVIEALNLRQHPAFAAGVSGAGPSSLTDAVEQLERRLKIEPIKRSRLIRITAKLPDRELAAAIPNQIAQEYIARTNAQRREASAAASRWLEGQLVGLRRRTEEATGTVQRFVKQHDLVPTREGRAEFVLQQLDDLNRAYTDAENDRIQQEARSQMLAGADSDTLAAALGSELVRTLKADYSRLEREMGRAKTIYGPEHPKMIALEAELSQAKLRLGTEIDKAKQAVEQSYQAAVRRAAELGRRLDAQRQTAIFQHARQMQLQLLRKEADATEGIYADLMKRLKEVRLAGELQVTNVRITAPARTPTRPVSPKPARDLVLATIGGLIGGVALALVREAGDKTLHTPREVSLLIRLPNVGMVPSVGGPVRRALPVVEALPARARHDDTASGQQLAGEAFGYIRALVRHNHALSPARVILVTSAQPQEGKSFTAVNLAVALAEGGEHVLLVDADLRRSSCHRVFGLEKSSVGLSSILYGGLAPELALLATGVTNLTFLPAGPPPPGPAALLSSERARALLQTLRERYPWIIIDSPPVLAVSDAAVLASLVDGVLLIVRAHATPVEAVQLARDALEAVGARMLGVVLNDVRRSRSTYSYGNYGYQDLQGEGEHDLDGGNHHLRNLARALNRTIADASERVGRVWIG
ncbi:MAG: GumC family protein [Candidatus Rokuibacteriota bacterium]